jgi:hypothetical protein
MDVLRWHTKKLAKTMPRHQAALYVSLQQGYFSGLAGITGIALLVAYFFGGIEISRVPLIGLLEWGAPFYLMRNGITLWIQQFNVRPKIERGLQLAGRVLSIAVWPIFLMALIGVLRQKHLSFKVTPKGGGSQDAVVPIALFRPHLVLAIVSLACVVAGLFEPHASIILMAWAGVNAVALGSFVIMAVFATWRSRIRSRPRLKAQAANVPLAMPAPSFIVQPELTELSVDGTLRR